MQHALDLAGSSARGLLQLISLPQSRCRAQAPTHAPPQLVTSMTSPSRSRPTRVMLLGLLANSVEAAVIRRIIESTEPAPLRASASAANGTFFSPIHTPTLSGITASPSGQIEPSDVEAATSAYCTLAEGASGHPTLIRKMGGVDLPFGAHLEAYRTLLVSKLGASDAMTLRITLTDASYGREPLLQIRASAATGLDYFDGGSQTRF